MKSSHVFVGVRLVHVREGSQLVVRGQAVSVERAPRIARKRKAKARRRTSSSP